MTSFPRADVINIDLHVMVIASVVMWSNVKFIISMMISRLMCFIFCICDFANLIVHVTSANVLITIVIQTCYEDLIAITVAMHRRHPSCSFIHAMTSQVCV